MIAPDPALAGPRPAASARETARSGEPPRDGDRAEEPKTQGGEDFDSFLSQGLATPAPEAVKPDPAGGADPAAAAAGGQAVVLLALVPGAPPPVEAAAPATAPDPVLAPAPDPGLAAPALAIPMPRPGPAASSEPRGAAPDRSGEGLDAPDAPRADTGELPAVAKRPATIAHAVPSPEPARAAPGQAEPPGPAAARPVEVSMAEAPRAAPREPEQGAGRAEPGGIALRDAAAPAWQLAADPGPVQARADAAAAQHAAQPARAPAEAIRPQALAGQVAVAVGRASDDRVEIRLDPPELGRVQIHLTRHDGAIQAVVLADRPETQDLLRRHAEVLARELGAAGYDSVSLDFAAGADTGAGRGEARGLDWAQAAQAAPAATVAASAEAATPRRSLAGGLDIRL